MRLWVKIPKSFEALEKVLFTVCFKKKLGGGGPSHVAQQKRI